MCMSRTSRRRVRHLHLALSIEEFEMIRGYADRLGLCMADSIRMAVRAALAATERLSNQVPGNQERQ